MASQPESATYDVGVLQLETTTPVQGGVGGASNSPLLSLSNRTAYLKAHVDALEALATGNAPLASPAFTGTPTVPNVTAGDSSTKVANTGFVSSATGGITSKSVAGGANVTLTAAEAGAAQLEFTGLITANIAVIVPTAADTWIVRNKTTGAFTLTVKTAAGTGVVVTQGKGVELSCDATNVVLSTDDFAGIGLGAGATATTQASGDASTLVATDAFVYNATDGMATVSVAGNSTVNLTSAQAGSALIKLTGALTGNIAVTVPANSGHWKVLNATTGGFTVTFTPLGGTGILVDQGVTTDCVSDASVMSYATNVAATQTAGDSSRKLANTAFVAAAVISNGVQPGAVVSFTSTTAPTGFVKANGVLLSRVTYAALWTFAQASGNIQASDAAWTGGGTTTAASYSPGDGSTTFRVPDLRGWFPRFADDGRGVDSGRTVGSYQADALLTHNHSATTTSTDAGHDHDTTIKVYNPGGSDNSNYGSQTGTAIRTGIGYASITSTTTVANNAGGAAENRVKNAALLACIKF